MPTQRFYLPSSGAAGISPAFDGAWGSTAGADRVAMVAAPSGTPFAVKSGTRTGAGSILLRQYVSPPLRAALAYVAFFGGWARGYASTGPNLVNRKFRIVSNNGLTVRTIEEHTPRASASAVVAPYSGQFTYPTPNNGAIRNINLSDEWVRQDPQPYDQLITITEGDRIILEVGATFFGGTSNTAYIEFGDSGAADIVKRTSAPYPQANPWIEIVDVFDPDGGGVSTFRRPRAPLRRPFTVQFPPVVPSPERARLNGASFNRRKLMA